MESLLVITAATGLPAPTEILGPTEFALALGALVTIVCSLFVLDRLYKLVA